VNGSLDIQTVDHASCNRRITNANQPQAVVASLFASNNDTVDTMSCHIDQVSGVSKTIRMCIWDALTGVLLANTAAVATGAGGVITAALVAPFTHVKNTFYYYGAIITVTDGQPISWYAEDISGSPLNNPPIAAGLATLAVAGVASNITVPINKTAEAVWIAAGSVIGVSASLGLTSVNTAVTPFAPPAPISGQELLVTVDTVAIGGPSVVTLPAVPNSNSRITVKDATGGSGVGGKSITVNGNGNLIDGLTTQLINSNFASLTMHWDGTQWRIV
jgi:hypothetical protein